MSRYLAQVCIFCITSPSASGNGLSMWFRMLCGLMFSCLEVQKIAEIWRHSSAMFEHSTRLRSHYDLFVQNGNHLSISTKTPGNTKR
ncbi:MAG: hypothetical protein NT040_02085 [Bacteroidetes bacterium]|nr:hypothetical protein [Bacteroidota bacterium]